jgi:hypothetical protein
VTSTTNRSTRRWTTYALSRRQRELVVNGDNPYLWNLAYPLLGSQDGTFYFENQPNMLDQFLVNKNMAKATSPIKADPTSVHIVRFPGDNVDRALQVAGRVRGVGGRRQRIQPDSPTTSRSR